MDGDEEVRDSHSLADPLSEAAVGLAEVVTAARISTSIIIHTCETNCTYER
jgi:hypothetical protein